VKGVHNAFIWRCGTTADVAVVAVLKTRPPWDGSICHPLAHCQGRTMSPCRVRDHERQWREASLCQQQWSLRPPSLLEYNSSVRKTLGAPQLWLEEAPNRRGTSVRCCDGRVIHRGSWHSCSAAVGHSCQNRITRINMHVFVVRRHRRSAATKEMQQSVSHAAATHKVRLPRVTVCLKSVSHGAGRVPWPALAAYETGRYLSGRQQRSRLAVVSAGFVT